MVFIKEESKHKAQVVTTTLKSITFIVKHLPVSRWWRMKGKCCCCCFSGWMCAVACGCTDRHRCEWLGGGHSLWAETIVMIWGSEQQADAENGRRKRRRVGGRAKAEVRGWRLDRHRLYSYCRQSGCVKGTVLFSLKHNGGNNYSLLTQCGCEQICGWKGFVSWKYRCERVISWIFAVCGSYLSSNQRKMVM